LGHEMALAMVHLTWSRHEERLPWPSTKYFQSWQDYLTQCMLPDHEEYVGS
jgi:hypothetical protein